MQNYFFLWFKSYLKKNFQMFPSINSSFPSEIYSIDESNSEIEWITPKIITENNNKKKKIKKFILYKIII